MKGYVSVFQTADHQYQCPDQIRTLGNVIIRDEQGQIFCDAWDVHREAGHCYLTIIK
jgi:hypothetical protein